MTQIFSIIFGTATLLAIAIYIASGFRHTLFLYLVTVSVLVIGYGAYAIGQRALLSSVLLGVCTTVLLVACLHDQIMNTKEPIENKYFDFLSYGIVIYVVPVVIKIFKFGISGDDIWFTLYVILPISSHFCRKSDKRHYQTFIVSGVTVILLSVFCIVVHPLLYGASINAENILISIKLGSVWFIMIGMFFLANYAKSGLLSDSSIHKKVFVIFVGLAVITLITRFPALQPFKELPLLKGLSASSSIGMLVFPASVGLVFRKKRNNT